MQFQFNSVQDFFAMGGHGLYVWLAYGTVAVVVLYLTLSVNFKEKQFMRQLKRNQQRIDNHQTDLVGDDLVSHDLGRQ